MALKCTDATHCDVVSFLLGARGAVAEVRIPVTGATALRRTRIKVDVGDHCSTCCGYLSIEVIFTVSIISCVKCAELIT